MGVGDGRRKPAKNGMLVITQATLNHPTVMVDLLQNLLHILVAILACVLQPKPGS